MTVMYKGLRDKMIWITKEMENIFHPFLGKDLIA